jgi:hypothetical protein
MAEPTLEVHPLTPDRWDDLAVLFDRPGDAAVEGYPKDTAGGRRHANEMFVGSVPMFRRAGFEEVGRRSPTRPIVRRVLSGRGGPGGRGGSR